MDFDLTEEQQLFADTSRRFLESECPVDAVRKLAETEAGFDRGWWQQAAELGWASLLVDEDYGGAGLGAEGVVYLALVAEEMGRLVSPGPLLPCNVVAAALSRSGNDQQRAEVLPRLAAGEAVAAWCLAEGGHAWGPAAVALQAERSGSGYRLNGMKGPVEAAAAADYLLVTARCEGGLGQFLVPGDTSGLSIAPLESLDLVRRHSRVSFDDVEVSEDALVGEVGGADDDVEYQTQLALVLQSAECSGAADRVLEFTIEWAFDRYSFGRPLASYQALKHRFADMKLWLEACHATTSAAVRAVADASADAPRLARVAKSYVGDHAPEIVQDCVQMHGGLGVTWEHDLHLYLRRVATNRMIYGAPAEHRAAIADLLEF